MQTNHDLIASVGLAGNLADSSAADAITGQANEIITPGNVVSKMIGKTNEVRLPVANQVVILDDGGTFTAGDIVTTVNGTDVTTSFAADKDTTMTAHAAAIQALPAVSTAIYSAGDHTITILAVNNELLEITVDISGITGTMTITSTTFSTVDQFLGIALVDNRKGFPRTAYDPQYDKVVITFTGDTLTTNDTVDVTINGTDLGTTTYATSEAATLLVIADKIEAAEGVVSATVNGRIITGLAKEGFKIKTVVTVTDDSAGDSSANVVHSLQNAETSGIVRYSPKDFLPIARKGRVKITVEEAVTSDDPVYVRFKDNGTLTRGNFRKDADSGNAVLWSNTRYASSAAANGVAIVEINLP